MFREATTVYILILYQSLYKISKKVLIVRIIKNNVKRRWRSVAAMLKLSQAAVGATWSVPGENEWMANDKEQNGSATADILEYMDIRLLLILLWGSCVHTRF